MLTLILTHTHTHTPHVTRIHRLSQLSEYIIHILLHTG